MTLRDGILQNLYMSRASGELMENRDMTRHAFASCQAARQSLALKRVVTQAPFSKIKRG
jgi:hypothetical protein